MITHRRYNKKKGLNGQAALELTIFCTLILLAFSTLLMYGQRMMAQQQLKMETFRNALGKAYDKNASVSITAKKDLRTYNLMGPFGQGQVTTVGASATAMWQKGLGGRSGSDGDKTQFAYYKLNNEEFRLSHRDKDIISLDGSPQTVSVPISVWREETTRHEQYSSGVSKEEQQGQPYKNTQVANLTDTTDTRLYVRFDKSYDDDPEHSGDSASILPDYSDEGFLQREQGAYYNETTQRVEYSTEAAGNTVRREKEWETNAHGD